MHIAYAALAGDLPPENTAYRDISLLAGEGEVSPAGKGGWLDTVMHVLYDITRVETMRLDGRVWILETVAGHIHKELSS
jgi:hypothetical protein